MSSRLKRIYTCTPVDFKGDASFFCRDSGLLSVGLRKIGCESMAIMPGPKREDDCENLIRTEKSNLEDPDWWKSLQLDCLVLYSWALPCYNAIAKALAAAGIPFIVNMDTNGLISRLASPTHWKQEGYRSIYEYQGGLRGLGLSFPLMLREAFTQIKPMMRKPHYEAATRIAAVTPAARLWIASEAEALGGKALADKVIYLPHAQEERYRFESQKKDPLVISVARWQPEDWPQKLPAKLLETYRLFLTAKPNWHALVVGRGATQLASRLGFAKDDLPQNLKFLEHLPPAELPALYNRASIGFWCSRNEGQQGTGAQALCCGCSVVSHQSARMSCFQHYVSRESGRLAGANHPALLAEALMLEADAWEAGQRDPQRISDIWCQEFHASEVAKRVIMALGLNPPGSAVKLSGAGGGGLAVMATTENDPGWIRLHVHL